MRQCDYLSIITLEDDICGFQDRTPEYSYAFDAESDIAAQEHIEEHLKMLVDEGTIVRTCHLHKIEYSTELIKND